MRLVYLSPVPWASFAQRPQKFVEWFNLRTGGEVLWLDPYPTRLPQPSDLKRNCTALSTSEAQDHYPWLQVLRPRLLPVEPLPVISKINHILFKRIIASITSFTRGQEALIVVGKPSMLAIAVLDALEDVPSVYDAMDEFPAFYKGLSSLSMAERERQLVQHVGHLWVTSTRLGARWSKERPDLHMVPNGLDASFFAENGPRLSTNTSKVFGYVGTIASWFDWQWIIALANARPHDSIHIIGPNFNPCDLALPPNIQVLSACSHKEAMLAMRSFDVGVIPFLRNQLTASVDPIKYYEYRASGLPVISTAFGEMIHRESEPGIFISHSLEDISELSANALTHHDPDSFTRDFAKEHCWHNRFDSTRILTKHQAEPVT
ncbi:glycosyl transferase [Pseudomonas mosselii]|uniref:glycosyl transferase n=1 Tax=Pseudomonas mosselii TaxID=78327 RepID=UPI0024487298|nr:glycosyl transferase [Pseudomonas mosselii]MDH1147176.1 glycosyl transferase [Pseudomonas mosselii]